MVQRVAIAGFGAIGKVVAAALDRGIEGMTLAAVSARDIARAEEAMAGFARPVPVLPLARLGEVADIVVECAPAAVLRDIAEPALAQGRTVIVLSCGALLDNFDLVELARRHGGRILVPTGALLGLDAVQGAAQGVIERVHMITRKPPGGLDGAPYLALHAISVVGLGAARRVFTGTAREAARGFPANVNVAAALAMAGIGPDRTTIEIWADPAVDRNIHRIEVEAELGPTVAADRKRAEPGKPENRPPDAAIGDRAVKEADEPARNRYLIAATGYLLHPESRTEQVPPAVCVLQCAMASCLAKASVSRSAPPQ